MDLSVGRVKRLGKLGTRAFWLTRSFVEVSTEEQTAGGASKTWVTVHWVGGSPVTVA